MAGLAQQLCDAAITGNVAALQAALAAGADPDVARGGSMALHCASGHGHLACVQALLEAGANPNAGNSAGWTPLHSAAHAGHEQCLAALLAAGADPDPAVATWTPLHSAASNGHVQCVRALLAAGADPAAVSSGGHSMLHSAMISCRDSRALEDTFVALLTAAPQLALQRYRDGVQPLARALGLRLFNVARSLLELGPLAPAEALASLEEACKLHRASAHLKQALARLQKQTYQGDTTRQPLCALYATLVARQPLTPAEWARVPAPCPGLGTALPAVLARSEAEAALLVQHLPPADCERLRTAALCIKRVEREHGVEMPPVLLRPLLLAAVE